MNRLSKKSFPRIVILVLLISGFGTLILWDHFRVNRDFLELKTLLSNVRYDAITNNKMLVARFSNRLGEGPFVALLWPFPLKMVVFWANVG